jgi:hypothetical protein
MISVTAETILLSRGLYQKENKDSPQILHGIITQKIELFITTAVRTSDPTRRYIPEDRTLHNHRCENLTSYTALYPRR